MKILFLFALFILSNCTKIPQNSVEESKPVFNKIRLEYTFEDHIKDSIIYDYKHTYFYDGLIQVVNNAYLDSLYLSNSYYNGDLKKDFTAFSNLKVSSDPYYLEKEDRRIYAFQMLNPTVKHLQYSLDTTEKTLYFNDSHMFDREDIYSIGAYESTYTGIDTIIYR